VNNVTKACLAGLLLCVVLLIAQRSGMVGGPMKTVIVTKLGSGTTAQGDAVVSTKVRDFLNDKAKAWKIIPAGFTDSKLQDEPLADLYRRAEQDAHNKYPWVAVSKGGTVVASKSFPVSADKAIAFFSRYGGR
jgi:hypothetical protein